MNKKVFVIEDEKDVVDLYRIELEAYDYEVESFETGKKAIDKIKEIIKEDGEAPKVIILDLLLPDISGLAILGELRGRPIFDKTSVIVLTNYVSESLQESVKQMENVEYLPKVDTTPQRLVELIKEKAL